MSDYKGADLTLDALPPAKELLADRGYDSDWYRQALQAKGIEPCIPGRRNRKVQPAYDAKLYRQPIASKTCSQRSRISDASQPDTTGVPTHSFQQSSSQHSCYFGSMSPEPRRTFVTTGLAALAQAGASLGGGTATPSGLAR